MAEASPVALVSVSALSGIALPSSAGVAQVVEAPIAVRFVLRAAPVVARRLIGVAGFEAPVGINRAVRTEAGVSLQLGPDEWLLLATNGTAADLAGAMSPAASGAAHALVEVTDRSVAMTLDGPRVEEVLAAGCPLPLDIEAFPPDRATRTIFAKAPIVLWRQERHRFQIEVARSFAPYLVASLAQAIATETAFVALQRP